MYGQPHRYTGCDTRVTDTRVFRSERGSHESGEAAVPVDVAADPGRDPVGEHLDDAAERIAISSSSLDLFDHAGLGRGIEAAQRRRVDNPEIPCRWPEPPGCATCAPLDHVGSHLDAEVPPPSLGPPPPHNPPPST